MSSSSIVPIWNDVLNSIDVEIFTARGEVGLVDGDGWPARVVNAQP